MILRQEKTVRYIGGYVTTRPGYGGMLLQDNDGFIYRYEFPTPIDGVIQDRFMQDIMMHHNAGETELRISFRPDTNIISAIIPITAPKFLGIGTPEEEEDPGSEEYGGGSGDDVLPAEEEGAEAHGLPADDIGFELWLFSMKRLGQTYDASLEIFNELSDHEKQMLIDEYNGL